VALLVVQSIAFGEVALFHSRGPARPNLLGGTSQEIGYGTCVNIGEHIPGEWVYLTAGHNLERNETPFVFVGGAEWVQATVIARKVENDVDLALLRIHHNGKLTSFHLKNTPPISTPLVTFGYPRGGRIASNFGQFAGNIDRERGIGKFSRAAIKGESGGAICIRSQDKDYLVGILRGNHGFAQEHVLWTTAEYIHEFVTVNLGRWPNQDQQYAGTKQLAVLNKPNVRVLYFGASWCPPCAKLNPLIIKLQNEGYPLGYRDVDKFPNDAKMWGVTSVPTFIRLENEKETTRHVGTIQESVLRGWFLDKKKNTDSCGIPSIQFEEAPPPPTDDSPLPVVSQEPSIDQRKLEALQTELRQTIDYVKSLRPIQGPPGPAGVNGKDGAAGKSADPNELRELHTKITKLETTVVELRAIIARSTPPKPLSPPRRLVKDIEVFLEPTK